MGDGKQSVNGDQYNSKTRRRTTSCPSFWLSSSHATKRQIVNNSLKSEPQTLVNDSPHRKNAGDTDAKTMGRPRRRLFLHLSALSDEEYQLFVGELKEVLNVQTVQRVQGDGDGFATTATRPEDSDEGALEERQMGVREVRGWMKGRYRGAKPDDIDKVRCPLPFLLYVRI